MRRGLRTLGLYGTYGCLGFLLTGLGSIVPELREERGLPRAEAALYPSGFALGLVVLGLVGPRLARRLGPYALPVTLAALACGCFLMAVGGDRAVLGSGALLLGFGGAGLVQLVPAELRAAHGDGGAVAIGEANAVASSASVLAPLVIGAVLGLGLGWRVGFAGPPVILAVVLLAVMLRPRASGRTERSADLAEAAGRAPAGFWGWWLDIVLVVAVEFCMLFWTVDFLRSVVGLPAGIATAASAAFVLGMAVARSVISRVVRLVGDTVRLLAGAAGLAALGFAVYWAVPVPVIAVFGLFLTGLGIALLYPVSLAEALAAWPTHPVRAAARCALASGVAIGLGPPLLGGIADQVGLRTASLIAPLLLLAFLGRCAVRARAARVASPA